MNIWANNRARILVTDKCNLNCIYCHNEGQPKSINMMSDSLVNKIDSLMKQNGRKLDSITFSGGETLLHPNLSKIIKILSKHSNESVLVTNGLLLNPNKIDEIVDAGITKIRLGVDSITKKMHRPSINSYSPKNSIIDTINLLIDRLVNFELNVVLSNYNLNELDPLLKFCADNKISAKFFEQLNVKSFGTVNNYALIKNSQSSTYRLFNNVASQYCGTQRYSDDLGEANIILDGDGFSFRYCHFLCDYGLCYKTGTRIDAEGSVYSCMNQRGKYWINEKESMEISLSTIRKALYEGCNFISKENVDNNINKLKII